MSSRIFILLLLNLTFSMGFAQKEVEKKSYDELEKQIDNPNISSSKRQSYANFYYKKAKKENDNIKMANAMYLIATVSEVKSNTLKYADSIIALTKSSNDFQYPAKGYILKGNFYLTNTFLNEALQNILIAEKYSIKTGNIEQNLLVKRYIGLIKIELGKPEEALPLYLENYNFFKSRDNSSLDFIFIKWVLSDIYIRLNKIDSALFYIDTSLKEIEKSNPYYMYFEMYKGICYHLKKDFLKSNQLIDSSIKSIKFTNDPLNLAVCYYFKGENILQAEKNDAKAKKYFEKVDSILLKSKKNSRDLRDNYIRLIEITKKQRDIKNQLYYLNRLIEIDSFLHKNNTVLSTSINKNYDTPHLLAEKEKIITNMNQNEYIYIGLGLLLMFGLGFSSYKWLKFKKEKQLYEERFNQLMKTPKIEDIQIDEDNTIIESKANEVKTFEVPKQVAEDILKKLARFEKSNGYLDPNIKQIDFAKTLDTNSSYLSKTINHYKGKNFSQYLNDLRINYTVKKLKESKKFRKYTIKAIAEEVGFNNADSFSKAFYNKTGLQPSYFIKKIDEIKEIQNF
ncbi:helix-turn-helix domain-containing protein [Flavobacterium amniphilum]|uniref:helix-turn-helix domain-containing protein n=1 Tax=Flavobacterium amniphilum TaxID=1834035 RepID=UPI00202A6746|nr:helix-turn-helix domain-containing protein [Flavobacterium amniphilum]MCL9807442.1 helix-turn-helix domain-containing protein [Flavobacterium amniphilum]